MAMIKTHVIESTNSHQTNGGIVGISLLGYFRDIGKLKYWVFAKVNTPALFKIDNFEAREFHCEDEAISYFDSCKNDVKVIRKTRSDYSPNTEGRGPLGPGIGYRSGGHWD